MAHFQLAFRTLPPPMFVCLCGAEVSKVAPSFKYSHKGSMAYVGGSECCQPHAPASMSQHSTLACKQSTAVMRLFLCSHVHYSSVPALDCRLPSGVTGCLTSLVCCFACLARVPADRAVMDVPNVGPLMGLTAGLVWRGFETWSQISFRNQVRRQARLCGCLSACSRERAAARAEAVCLATCGDLPTLPPGPVLIGGSHSASHPAHHATLHPADPCGH
jgi:hypothetical protein